MPILLILALLLTGCLPPASRPLSNCIPGESRCDHGNVIECSEDRRLSLQNPCVDIAPVRHICVQTTRTMAECVIDYSDGGAQ